VPAPQSYDAEGHPWCACCTAQLSDDDLHSPEYATPPIPTFAIDFAGTKTCHRHTLTYTMTSLASTEQTPTIIAPNTKSRKRNRPSRATSQTIDRQPATQTHPRPRTSNASHRNSCSRDTNAKVDAYLKESTASTTRSTAPKLQTCNQVTPIDNLMVPRYYFSHPLFSR
jgi:hypothetical protein